MVISSAVLRAAWAIAEVTRASYGEVDQEPNSLYMFGEGSIFSCGRHVPAKDLTYFKPPVDDFVTTLKNKDRSSAKAWEYINAARVWTDIALEALAVSKTSEGIKMD